MILGFPRSPTVVQGGELELCVSTEAAAFRAELYRWGAQLVHQASSGWREGRAAPPHLPFQDWSRDNVGLAEEELPAWPTHRVPIDDRLPPGVYVAVLLEGDGRGSPPPPASPEGDARSARALFVVRPSQPAARIIYKLPLFTWHAYNQVTPAHWARAEPGGGWCLYSDFLDLPLGRPLWVSVRRPGGGTGGTTFDTFNPDPFDPTPRQTFVHWDARAVAWLERAGHAVDFCTDLDLHERGAELLAPYRLLLSVGHDEYWSPEMREAVERFVAAGGNAAFLGGNTCWWRIAFDAPFVFRRAGHWHATRPENTLTGVSFRNGGERTAGLDAPAVGYAVQHADHWLFAGTGLRDRDVFGAARDEYLVGYECDGAHFDRARLGTSAPVRPTGADGTPPDFTILGIGDVAKAGWGEGNRAATLGTHSPGGTVFTAATTDWPRLLATSPIVERITQNVLARLG